MGRAKQTAHFRRSCQKREGSPDQRSPKDFGGPATNDFACINGGYGWLVQTL